jgi:4-carboxymuconolactone decarboxylase
MRLAELHPTELSGAQREFQAALARSPRGASAHGGPFAVWLHNPQFGQRAQEFGAYVRYATSLQPRHSELAILVCARHWMAQYEWWVHAPIALQAGLPATALEAIRTGRQPSFGEPSDAVLYQFCMELLGTKHVSQATYAQALAAFGTQTLIEIVGVIGYYSLVAMTVLAFDAQPPVPSTFEPME